MKIGFDGFIFWSRTNAEFVFRKYGLKSYNGSIREPVVKTHVVPVNQTPEESDSEHHHGQKIAETPDEQLADGRTTALGSNKLKIRNHHPDGLSRGCQEEYGVEKKYH